MRVIPFRGFRYARGGSRDLTDVVAPPYDQIGSETRDRLLGMSQWNIVRVTLPADAAAVPVSGAPATADPYAGARLLLDEWLAAGVFRAEDRPAVYPYHQTYAVGQARVTRRGFIALGEVGEYAEGVVRPHERTHRGPKEDRLRLLEATGADIGLLFMLVSDADGRLERATAPEGEPIAEARDLRGEAHRLWRIVNETRIAEVQALMASRPAIIADGHHRYETAVEYARRRPEARLKLMAFFALEAPGLTILANHRLVRDVPGFDLTRFLGHAARWFAAEPLADPVRFRPTPDRIGLVAGREARVLALRDGASDALAWPAGTSPAWRRLAVSILHEGLLRPLLGITDEHLEAQSRVGYTADQAEAVALARAGRCQAAFLIAPTTPAELEAVVAAGEVLPQKSTHFYPKLLDGLVWHRLGAA